MRGKAFKLIFNGNEFFLSFTKNNKSGKMDMKTAKAEINKTVNELKKQPKVMAIILFGSYVKGEQKPISDIDIAVIAKEPDKAIEAEVSSFSSNIFDLVNFHRLPLYIQFEVLKYGKPLFVRDEEYFSQIKMAVLKEYLEMTYLYERMSRRVLA